ncbi:hypothetical protein OQ252_11435 [Acetobacter farinalis]|uniref:Uncharacterized protein n=1 Tax=Acetobacter farinalis TaxID=1260984 RepID=A0ABT3Q9N3_9PROT|nr:hypothetical protein [Acetobacter farinalis]MCX2562003.1 hypothetical protein [Acetobacter farinalis]
MAQASAALLAQITHARLLSKRTRNAIVTDDDELLLFRLLLQ